MQEIHVYSMHVNVEGWGLEQEVVRGAGWSTEGLGFEKLNQEWWGFPTEAFMVYSISNRV